MMFFKSALKKSCGFICLYHFLVLSLHRNQWGLLLKNLVMRSEVEINKDLITVGDVVYYMDSNNCDKWIIDDVFEEGFVAVNSDGVDGVFYFKELQVGWIISDNTKEKHRLEDRYIYKAI